MARDLCPSLDYGAHQYINGTCASCGAQINDDWKWYWRIVRERRAAEVEERNEEADRG